MAEKGMNQKSSSISEGRTHYPALDGLRGIAILLVMLIHYVEPFEPWSLVDRMAHEAAGIGWVGVDLFFALSGFLITGILLDTKESPSYWRTFIARRSLRIFPLYFCFVGALAITAYTIAPQALGSQRWIESQAWYWAYGVNFLVAGQGTWAAAPMQTGHLWSLAIEEQFYLLWPLVVWLFDRATLLRICIGLCACALVLRACLVIVGVDPVAIFILTPTRIDPLLAGAAVAALVREGVRARTWPVLVGALGLSACVLLNRSTSQYQPLMLTLGLSAAALLFAGAVHLAAQRGSRVLLTSALTSVGKYSYGIYVLHQFAFWCVASWWSIPESEGVVIHWVMVRAIVAGILALLLALGSWHLIEKRFLAWKPPYEAARAPATDIA